MLKNRNNIFRVMSMSLMEHVFLRESGPKANKYAAFGEININIQRGNFSGE